MHLKMNSPRTDLLDELALVYARTAVDALLAQQGCVGECNATATTGAPPGGAIEQPRDCDPMETVKGKRVLTSLLRGWPAYNKLEESLTLWSSWTFIASPVRRIFRR
jgi:hypothetical protein